MRYLSFFGWNFKKAFLYLKSTPSSFSNFNAKKMFCKLGNKIPYLGSFGLEFKNTIVITEISALEFF